MSQRKRSSANAPFAPSIELRPKRRLQPPRSHRATMLGAQSQRGRHRRAFRHAHGLRPRRARHDPGRPTPRPTSAGSAPIPATWTPSPTGSSSAASPPWRWNRPAFTGFPLFELLEARGFEVWLVEPGQLSHCGARPKTDVLDCPVDPAAALLRPAAAVVPAAGFDPGPARLPPAAANANPLCRRPHVQHMQKALEQMNVKLTEVVADITGLTGQRIIAAILEGERRSRDAGRAARSPVPHTTPPRLPRPWKGPGGPNTSSPCKQALRSLPVPPPADRRVRCPDRSRTGPTRRTARATSRSPANRERSAVANPTT